MNIYKQNKVSTVVWPWQETPPQTHRCEEKKFWIEATVETLISSIIACLLFFKWDKPIMATVVFCVGGFFLFAKFAIPTLYSTLRVYLLRFAHFVGLVLTWVLLVPVFYLCFVPGRFIQRLKGNDPLTRKCPSNEVTYWVPRPPTTDMNQYKKQH
ncbi:MAG: hypothetical protein GKR87_14110 [Kiritimatiellae bacterium]|nr:hypothetical protein [Kiritimatiellia bacterium]